MAGTPTTKKNKTIGTTTLSCVRMCQNTASTAPEAASAFRAGVSLVMRAPVSNCRSIGMARDRSCAPCVHPGPARLENSIARPDPVAQ